MSNSCKLLRIRNGSTTATWIKVMFKSVADLAEERRLCPPAAHANGHITGHPLLLPCSVSDPAPGDRQRHRHGNGGAERLDGHLSAYERERELERERERERSQQSSNRVQEFEELIARTRGMVLDDRPPPGAAPATSKSLRWLLRFCLSPPVTASFNLLARAWGLLFIRTPCLHTPCGSQTLP